MIRGPRSRAGLIAYPVVPPSESPIAHTSMPTRYGPSPGGTVPVAFEPIAATTRIRTNVPSASEKRLGPRLSIAGDVLEARQLQIRFRCHRPVRKKIQPDQHRARHRAQHLRRNIRR